MKTGRTNRLWRNIFGRVIVLLILFGLFLSLTTAQSTIPPLKTNTCGQLIQTCSNCSFVNITAIHYPSPNNTILYLNSLMTKTNNVYNYSFCDTGLTGEYFYDTLGNPNGVPSSESISFQVTQTGQTLDNAKALLYIAIFVIAVLAFVGCFVFAFMIPGGNSKDEMTGYILAVSSLKYAKIVLYGGAYLILMLIMWLSFTISTSYLDMDFLGNLFHTAFTILVVGVTPGFILMVYFLIANAVRDHKVGEALSQNLRIKDDY